MLFFDITRSFEFTDRHKAKQFPLDNVFTSNIGQAVYGDALNHKSLI